MENNEKPVQKMIYDIAILGSGLGGTILGSILAKNGLRVVLIDKSAHPRFAIGESTVPQTTIMMKMLAERYDVPELHHLSSFEQVSNHINTNCGRKSLFGFVYHQDNRFLSPLKTAQTPALLDELHLFRQDTDAYMLQVANRYGCKSYENTTIDDIDINEDRVKILTTDGTQIQSKYVVDGTGYNSILANKFELRDSPTPFKTHSRGLFTHMVGVQPYDNYCPPQPEFTIPWHDGTLHHIFERGWLWVIPFNNHSKPTNPLCSVGLMLDSKKYPKSNLDPEEEFFYFLSRYPNIAVQFKEAKSVREWISTDRIQYSSTKCVGDRFCLLSHSTGFVDPLFSRGLLNTVETINLLAHLLLNASKNNKYDAIHFSDLEALQQGLIAGNDRLVNCSYISFKRYSIWQVWQKMWELSGGFATLKIVDAYINYLESRDCKYLSALDHSPFPGAITDNEEVRKLFIELATVIEGIEEDHISEEEAERQIASIIKQKTALIKMVSFLISTVKARILAAEKTSLETT